MNTIPFAASLLCLAGLPLGMAMADPVATPVPGATTPPSPQQQLRSGENQIVIDQTKMQSLGPQASPAQGVIFAPGGVAPVGASGASGQRIMLDGLGVGSPGR